MTQHRDNLIAALHGIAKFHLADNPSMQIEYMDTPEELYARWRAAHIKRDWFLAQFTEAQRASLAAFGARFEAISAKYNKLPPILQFVTSADGKALCALAASVLDELEG